MLDVDANSDYGAAFARFHDDFANAVTRRTTVVVLGDGRGNGNDANMPVFEEIARRCRRLVWPRPSSGTPGGWAAATCHDMRSCVIGLA